MNNQTPAISNAMSTLADDARAATPDVAGEKVGEASKCLPVALDKGKEICGRVCEKALEGARATDETVRENPYTTIGMAFGVGALIGFLLTRRIGNGD